MLNLGRVASSLILFVLLQPAFQDAKAANAIRTVALSAEQAPGTANGSVFNVFEAPTLNNFGNTAFASYLAVGPGGVDGNSSRGVWSEGRGPLSLVAQGNQAAPGTPSGALFGNFEDQVLLSDSGDVAFVGQLRFGLGGVNSINDFGIWSQVGGNLSLVARERDQAPGTPNGANFSTIGRHIQTSDPHEIAFSNSGQLAFGGRISNNSSGEGGVTNSTGSGIWTKQSDSNTVFVRSGDQAPETPEGTLFQVNTADLPSINASGRVAIAANLVGPNAGVNATNNRGIWSNGSGAVELIARKGSPAPGFDSGEIFGEVFPPSINNNGHVAFIGTARQNNTSGFISANGVWSNREGPLSIVARQGMQAPGAVEGVKFQGMGSAVINGEGKVAFAAFLQNLDGDVPPSIADRGIWVDADGELKLVARSGLQLLQPGDPAELKLGTPVPGYSSESVFSFFNDYVLNGAGKVAFFATVFNPRVSGSSRGIWGQDRSGVLRLIVGMGSQIDVDNGPGVDLRTVNAIRFAGTSGNEDGHASAFNDSGQLAFAARFTDDSWGVFVSNVATVPEPSASLLGLIAILLHSLQSRRRQCSPAS